MKKTVLSILVFALICGCSFAQNVKHAVGFMVRPAWSDVSQSLLDQDNQSGSFAFSTGVLYSYKLNKMMEIQGGMAFSTLGEKYQAQTLRWGTQHDGSGGWAGPDPNLPNDFEMSYTYFYLDVSAGLKLYFNESRFRFFAFPYVETNIFLSSQSSTRSLFIDGQTRVDNLISYRSPNLRSPNLSGGLGLGMDVILGPKVSLFILPSYEYMLLSMGKRVDTEKSPRFFNAGVALGVMYRP